jgi:glycosyltransferase involved in cell wall biosynthesis
MPLVTVIIPTINRPQLVERAVRSALDQTLTDIEVMVVVDGPDDATTTVLGRIDDPRVRIVPLPANVGAGGARNAGVARAGAVWIALLDDDDEWMPAKLEAQLRTAEHSRRHYPLVSCRLIARTDEGDLLWPLRYPDPGEPLSEYLFCQRGIRGGEGVVPPSTILMTKALIETVPFRTGLPMRTDVDWLLRAASRCDVRPEFVPEREPLVVWNMQEGRDRISASSDWRFSLDWIRESRPLVTRRAYAAYVLTSLSLTASRTRQWRLFWTLVREAFRHGWPSHVDLMAHVVTPFPTARVLARLLLVAVSRVASTAGFLREGMSSVGGPAGRRKPETVKDVPEA